jgi:hypothetical protein
LDSSYFFLRLLFSRQVIVGPSANSNDKNEHVDEQEGGPWYFSLNNRRLWVLKRCREEGLLQSSNNRIRVRVRAPKSAAERERYSVEKCALEAKIVPEKTSSTSGLLSKKNKKGSIKRGDDSDNNDHDEAATAGAGASSSAIDDVPLPSRRTEEMMVSGSAAAAADVEEEEDDDSSSSSSSSGGFASTNPFNLLA